MKLSIEKQRNLTVDYLRALGTLLVILAHVNPPPIIENIRCFDMISLVFASGLCISYSSYCKYLIKRIKRIVFPAWIMMTSLFVLSAVACFILQREQLYSINKMLKSYLFLNGSIGFVWIVRIYMMIAICSPIIVMLNKKIESDFLYVVLLITAVVGVQVLPTVLNSALLDYVIEFVVYSSVAALGFRCKERKSKKCTTIIGIVCLLTVIVLCFLNGFCPNDYKYPPREFYLAYGMLITIVLFFIFSFAGRMRDMPKPVVSVWLSKNSYDIYLVHIVVLSFANVAADVIKFKILEEWWIKYLFVLMISILTVKIIEHLRRGVRKNERGK